MAAEASDPVIFDPESTKRRGFKRIKSGLQSARIDSSKPIEIGNLIDEEGDSRIASCKRSFRDTVTGEAKVSASSVTVTAEEDNVEYSEEMFDGRIVIEEKLVGDYECPSFTLSKWEEARIQKPWRRGLIVKLLGRKIGYKALEMRLNQLWVSTGVISIIDLSNDFFLVTFTSDQDREFALTQGPWLLYDHYLTVREWSPNFHPGRATLDRLSVWVRFSGLPIEYYDPSFLHFVGNRIGRTIKVDNTTLARERGKYARLCVEIDLAKPLLAIFEVKDRCYKIEYEGLHMLCLQCGRFGHYKEGCPHPVISNKDATKESSATDEPTEKGNMWTIVQKTRPPLKKKQGAGRGDGWSNYKKGIGSRFDVLSTQEQNVSEKNAEEIIDNNQDKTSNFTETSRFPKRFTPDKKGHEYWDGRVGSGKKEHNEEQKGNNKITEKSSTVTNVEEKIEDEPKVIHKDVVVATKGNSTGEFIFRGLERYEDIAEMDTNGNITITTKGIGTQEGNVLGKHHDVMKTCSLSLPQNQELRPPDTASISDQSMPQQECQELETTMVDVINTGIETNLAKAEYMTTLLDGNEAINMIEDTETDSQTNEVDLGTLSNNRGPSHSQ